MKRKKPLCCGVMAKNIALGFNEGAPSLRIWARRGRLRTGPNMNGNTITLDVGGTYLRHRIVRAEEVCTDSIPVPKEYSVFLQSMRVLRAKASGPFDRVGVSIGASVTDGVVVASRRMPDFVGRTLRSDLEAIFKAPCSIGHDCVCALLELLNGDVVQEATGYVTVSTGLGAAIAVRAGDIEVFQRVRIAHQVVHIKGEPCRCGRRGCLTGHVGSATLTAKLGYPIEQIKAPAFWEDYADHLATGIQNLVALFMLRRLWIGGGVLRNEGLVSRLAERLALAGVDVGYSDCQFIMLKDFENLPLLGARHLGVRPNARYIG